MAHAVIFDIDGTLLDSSLPDDELYRAAVRMALGDVRLRPDLTDYETVTDSGILLQILADNDLPADAEKIESVRQLFFGSLQSHIDANGPFPVTDGAADVLQRLIESTQHEVAIATGGWRQSAEIKLTSAGIEIEAIPLATSDDAIERASIMQVALRALGQDFESITYFGDGVWDQRACAELDWNFRAVGPALGGIDSFRGLYDG